MRKAMLVLVLLPVLILSASVSAPAQPGCFDNPDYYCFARCDNFWRYCVQGSTGCWMMWAVDHCWTDHNVNQCCIHTIRPGLF